MQWTDCPILTASVLLLYPSLGPSSLDTSFCSPVLSFGKQPSSPPFFCQSTFPYALYLYVCLSVSICLCLSVCLAAPVHALCCRLMFRNWKFLILPSASFSLSLGPLDFFPSLGAVCQVCICGMSVIIPN